MLVCQDRDCGHKKSVSRVTNARCPQCHKKMEMRGQGEAQTFTVNAVFTKNYLLTINEEGKIKIKKYPKMKYPII